jgi:hypothetical protein
MGVESKATLLAPRTCGRPEQQFSAGYELNRQMTVAYRPKRMGFVKQNRKPHSYREGMLSRRMAQNPPDSDCEGPPIIWLNVPTARESPSSDGPKS